MKTLKLPSNLKFLREKHKFSQQELSEQLGVPRSSLSDYERGQTQIGLESLIKLGDIFKVSIDALLTSNLAHHELEIARDKDLRILAISVDSDNRNNVELVETKAAAGYLQSFSDPEYIRDLPKITFPHFSEGTYRAFEIQGDSMLPLESGSIVICTYVEKLKDLKKNKTYVIISKNEGLVYKRILPDPNKQRLILLSDNEDFTPYDIALEDIDEIWQYYAHVGFNDVKKSFNYFLEEKISHLQQTLNEVHHAIVKK
ncbi:MAG: helix-turn-helix domain-containing protein [Saprospiraceae bacterium]